MALSDDWLAVSPITLPSSRPPQSSDHGFVTLPFGSRNHISIAFRSINGGAGVSCKSIGSGSLVAELGSRGHGSAVARAVASFLGV